MKELASEIVLSTPVDINSRFPPPLPACLPTKEKQNKKKQLLLECSLVAQCNAGDTTWHKELLGGDLLMLRYALKQQSLALGGDQYHLDSVLVSRLVVSTSLLVTISEVGVGTCFNKRY